METEGGGKAGEESLHPLSIRLGFGAALPSPTGLQAPAPPPARGHGVVLTAHSIAVFLAGHAEVLITVSQEDENQRTG